MSDEIKLNANIREDFSGSRLNALRREGKIPAVLYGPDIKNTSIYVDEKEFKSAISTEHGENALIKINVEGSRKSATTIIKEIQVHPVTMKIMHVDFGQIKLTEKVEVEVPVEVEGEAPGVKNEGGVLEHIIRKVRVRCLPTSIPDNFILDVSELAVGDHLTIADIPAVEGVEILADPEALVINLVPPTEFKEPEETELEEEAEPEVIGREKEEEEEEEEKEKKKPEKEEPVSEEE